MGADANKNSIIAIFFKILQGFVLTDGYIIDDFYPAVEQGIKLCVDNIAGQPVGRDADS